MQATPVMNTNAGRDSWEYWRAQGKRKSGQNLSRSQKKRNWKHSSIRTWVKLYSEWSSGSLDLPGPATADWWRIPSRWTCWWACPTPVSGAQAAADYLMRGRVRSKCPDGGRWSTNRGDLAAKYRPKMNCRESAFKKLTVIPKNLKAAHCSAVH